jgi:hypothetical protein
MELRLPFTLKGLREMKHEVEHLGTGEFLLYVEEVCGEEFTSFAAQAGMDVIVRQRFLEMINARIEELEGNNGNTLSSLS